MQLMDCTLRDGANVLGKGFPADLTRMILEGLIVNHVKIIEFGNAGGIGAYEVANMIAPLTDIEYLELAKPYVKQAELGMFLNAKRYREANVELAAEYGLSFLRVGAEPGEDAITVPVIRAIKAHGLKARYSLMKAYLATPEEAAEEARRLQDAGLDEITIMDSAGTMVPDEVSRFTEKMTAALEIPVAFHCHNNLGLSAANALAAWKSGAAVLDCGLLGMARSAGNLATELAVALMQRQGLLMDIDLYGLLRFLEKELIPAMEVHNYHTPITPIDLTLGLSGAHSSFLKTFHETADQGQVDVNRLIVEVSKVNRRNPSKDLMDEVARSLKNQGM